ncbi:MAG TPA: mechanosensitive ion channel family protein [Pyrinomonadaceae bacterium]|nr:mechanosensitive ion channel family protein [Pyrinomonadaceae bacterium]
MAESEKQKRRSEVKELEKDEDVRRELEHTGGEKPDDERPKVPGKHKLEISSYIVLLIAFGAFYYLLRFGYFDFAAQYASTLQRFTLGLMAIALVLIVMRIARVALIQPLENNAARYNLNRVATLLTAVSIFLIALSVLFASWYTAFVSFGLISLVLGLALQTPISSFIGWIYILVKVPYQVGDRIMIDNATGDVIDVSYTDTTLWEFGGVLSTDHPSGRIIRFPNSKVLNSIIYNYSWPLFPYIWSEIKFQIAYQSDLEFVAKVMRETAAEEIGEAMMEHVRTYRELLEQTPVDELEVKEYPAVVFRVNENTWLEAIIRYLVEPRRSGQVKTRLIKEMLKRLNAAPERVMFPKADAR